MQSPIGGESLLQRSKLFACPLKPPLCKGRWHGAAVTEGLSTQIMPKFPFAFGVAESPKGDSPYGAADTLSRGLRRILCGGTCKPIAGSHAAEPMGWISSYLDRRPLPRHGGGVGGAESSAASGGCSEAEHPQRSKKSSKRAARRFFRAPQGGRDCDWPRRGPCGSRTRRFSRLTARPFLTIMELENIPRKEC